MDWVSAVGACQALHREVVLGNPPEGGGEKAEDAVEEPVEVPLLEQAVKDASKLKVKSGDFDKLDNPLKNAPHTHLELSADEWKHLYKREEAAFPNEYLKVNKFWPPVGRVDNVFGDRNLVCSCPSLQEYKEEAA